MDIGVVRYNAKDILPANIQAKPEEGEVTQKLIPTLSDAEIEEVRYYGAIVKGQISFFFFRKKQVSTVEKRVYSVGEITVKVVFFFLTRGK